MTGTGSPTGRPAQLSSERLIETVLTAHETYWALLATLLRALETDEEAATSLHRHVRDAMGQTLLSGYEGHEPTPRRPPLQAHHKAELWVGMQLLRDIGPRGLSEVDWLALARTLTALAGPRIRHPATRALPTAILADHTASLGADAATAARRGTDRRPRRPNQPN